ncbi:hypothetical protein CAPTEDRAFT_188113 [Capitella teleta]|uniref:Jacalin-type lectin domain-containing protein n=1 Tax=Capitella teleta TaxID=283909 RepID=R7V8E2_CAPTE|nr:hypothetical protein CAPTEDRAFT_188113 [Capitella teleta]|eukprot:ELU12030.1 hypothetical protein CAPTEDRAFT_188113 [Capitella teleta]
MALKKLTEETTWRLEQISVTLGLPTSPGPRGPKSDPGPIGSNGTDELDSVTGEMEDNGTPVFRFGPFGGSGGSTIFDDFYVSMNDPITSIRTTNGHFIDKYGTTWGPLHGGPTIHSTSSFVILRAGEVIKRVEMRKRPNAEGTYLLSGLKFVTNQRSNAWHGSSDGIPGIANGGRLRYIAGRHGASVDSIRLYFDVS